MTTQPKTALITGVTGQDGAYLAELLLDKGYAVHGIKRRTSLFNTDRIDHLYKDRHDIEKDSSLSPHPSALYLHHGDMTDSSSLVRIIQHVQPDEIYNLAAQSHVAVSFEEPEYTANSDALGAPPSPSLRAAPPPRHCEQHPLPRHCEERSDAAIHAAPGSPRASGPRDDDNTTTTTFNELVAEMVREDLKSAERDLLRHCQQRPLPRHCQRRPLPRHCQQRDLPRHCQQRPLPRHCEERSDVAIHSKPLDAKPDWGHAKDYVEMQWLMLQQETPEDFVIATGVQYSVRDFINAAAKELGMQIRWEGQGVEEKGYWLNRHSGESRNPAGYECPIIAIDPRYFRPTEVETLLGDPTKAREKLGWTPKIKIIFDSSKPDGTMRKLLDVSRMKQLGWQAKTGLRAGIEQAYADFLALNRAPS